MGLLPVIAALAVSAPAPAQGFGPEQSLATGGATRAFVVDLDGDGRLDVLGAGSRPFWSRNEGDRSFSGGQPIDPTAFAGVGVGAGGGSPIQVGDLDGDGDADVVTLTQVDQLGVTLFVLNWYPNRGAGVFGGLRDIAESTERVRAVRVVDLDGDGFNDLLVVREPEEVNWIRNRGTGQVNAATFDDEAPLSGPGRNLWNADAADIDGDGDADVVAVSRTAGRVYVCKNNGGGDFATPVLQGARTNTNRSFDLVDMDLDGDPDVLIGDSFGTGMYWHVNDGNGAFATRILVGATGQNPSGVHGGDLDGDGDVDIIYGAVDSGAGVRWFERTGPTSFAPRQDLFSGVYVTADEQLGCADIDGDGALDPWSVGGSLRWSTSADGTAPWNQRLIGYSSGFPGGACPIDHDGDGDLDIAVTDSLGARVLPNRGDGIFGEPLPIQLGFDSVSPPLAVDVDGDGDDDLITSIGQYDSPLSVRVHDNLGGGNFAPSRIIDIGTGFFSDPVVATGDLDTDGDVDIYVSYPGLERWLENDGLGNFTALPSGHRVPNFSVAVDVDGDGRVEMFAVTSGGTFQSPVECALVMHEVAATGAVGPPVTLRQFVAGCPPYQGVALHDITEDGIADVLHLDPDAGTIDALPGLGGGAFGPPLTLAVALSDVSGIEIMDVDLDGRGDVIARGLSEAHWHRGLGPGALDTGRVMQETGVGAALGRFYPVDLDGDGDLDIVKSPSLPVVQLNETRLGVPGCAGVPNSTGAAGTMFATGSGLFIANDVTLRAVGLPAGEFGIFLTALGPAVLPGLGGGAGTLCLEPASVGRFSRSPSEILSTGAAGEVALAIDLGDLPSPFGAVAAQFGETRHFQFWHRDVGPFGPSNLTGSLWLRLR